MVSRFFRNLYLFQHRDWQLWNLCNPWNHSNKFGTLISPVYTLIGFIKKHSPFSYTPLSHFEWPFPSFWPLAPSLFPTVSFHLELINLGNDNSSSYWRVITNVISSLCQCQEPINSKVLLACYYPIEYPFLLIYCSMSRSFYLSQKMEFSYSN